MPSAPAFQGSGGARERRVSGYYFAEADSAHAGEEQAIELIAGGPGVDPFERLVKGDADVALGWLSNAIASSM